MRDMDLTSPRLFIAVCDSGNITRAAEQEHLVPSAISKRLAQLEADLGVALLQRQRRGVAPTPAGELLLEQARALLASAQRTAQDVAGFGSGVRGRVRLLATVSSISERLPDDLAAFLQKPEHRQIQVDIDEGLSRDIVRRVREGSAALGVLWDATPLEGLKSAPYRNDHLAVVVPPDHPLASRKRCAFADTLDFDHVGLQSSTAVNLTLARAAALVSRTLHYRTQVSNFEATLRVVKARLGISIIPKEIASAYAPLLDPRLVPLTDAWARRRFAICYRDRDAMPKAAVMLLDHLVQAARADKT